MLNDSSVVEHIQYVMLVIKSPYRMLHFVRVLLGWAQNSDLGSVCMEVGDLR